MPELTAERARQIEELVYFAIKVAQTPLPELPSDHPMTIAVFDLAMSLQRMGFGTGHEKAREMMIIKGQEALMRELSPDNHPK